MSGMPEFKSVVKDVSAHMRNLRESQPELMAAFSQLAAAGTIDGALSKKTRELVALGIAIASRCDDCIGFHVQALVKLGTTRAELEEVLGTAVYMGGGPSMMYATHALAAFEQFSA
ncbi:carboxymuconolactone decarboxylase family protein [Ralstonia mojiangensis]|uniref:carboxymuconolactone decarboxylase family protein n=1 Tax=Ralstonia mojiangensis TaxID=2953895 RepID=UPI0021B40836|nr:carboxymuconolactone decarboxylase family protein [Ralstonia mojiangensis]MCT7324719.1 carboxymuconolactone decarboxylase family protein [Ralstonia mojiangensis]